MINSDEQHRQKLEQFWRYLLTGKQYNHVHAWYCEILKTQGNEVAELFKRRVNYINKAKIL